MPFPSLPDTGAEKGQNISNTALFHFAALPMHLPQKNLTFPTIPTAWTLSSGNSDALLPGTAIPAGATAGKGNPSVLTLLWGPCKEFCFHQALPWNSWGSLGAFQVVSCALCPPRPLHCTLIHLHIVISAHLMEQRAFPLKNTSLESDLSNSSGTFNITLCLFFG